MHSKLSSLSITIENNIYKPNRPTELTKQEIQKNCGKRKQKRKQLKCSADIFWSNNYYEHTQRARQHPYTQTL